MSIDLSNLVTSLQLEISPPGENLYPNMTDDEATNRLIDSFWELRLMGLDFLTSFTCDSNGIVTYQGGQQTIYSQAIPAAFYEDNGILELGREIQQLIVLMAGYRITLAVFANTFTSNHAKAGSVETTTSKSATLLSNVLKAIKNKIDMALSRLSDLGMTTVMVYDAVMNMGENVMSGVAPFVGSDFGPGPMGAGFRDF